MNKALEVLPLFTMYLFHNILTSSCALQANCNDAICISHYKHECINVISYTLCFCPLIYRTQ